MLSCCICHWRAGDWRGRLGGGGQRAGPRRVSFSAGSWGPRLLPAGHRGRRAGSWPAPGDGALQGLAVRLAANSVLGGGGACRWSRWQRLHGKSRDPLRARDICMYVRVLAFAGAREVACKPAGSGAAAQATRRAVHWIRGEDGGRRATQPSQRGGDVASKEKPSCSRAPLLRRRFLCGQRICRAV